MNIVVDRKPNAEDMQYVLDQLIKFNDSQIGYHIDIKRPGLFLKDDDGNIMGGVQPVCFEKWVYITHLWVAEQHRGKGYGQKLLLKAEKQAIELGCEMAMLDTYSFQAPIFYEKFGYQMIAKIDDQPIEGVAKYYYRKRLV